MAYIVSVLEILIFYIIIVKRLSANITAQITMTIIFSIFLLMKLMIGLWLSLHDPSDPIMIATKNK